MTLNTPILALATYNDEVVSISTAEHLAKLFPLNKSHTIKNEKLAL
jgi:predicted esterase